LRDSRLFHAGVSPAGAFPHGPWIWSGLCIEQRFIGGSRIHQATGSL